MTRTANTRLALLMEEADWRAAQLARALRAIATEQNLTLAVHPSSVRRWLEGTQPRPPLPALLLECLSRRLGRHITAHDAGLTRAPAAVVEPSWDADPLRKLVHLTQAELDPNRRLLLGSGVFDATALAVATPAKHTLQFTGRESSLRDGHRTGQGDVEQLRSMAAVFAAAASRHGGQHVRAALAAYLSHEAIPLLYRPARDTAQRDLVSATAQLTLLLGSMCADCCHHATAQHYHQIAARLAADAGDTSTLAIALRTRSAHAHDLGQHGAVVLRLAEQADQHAAHARHAVRASTQIHLAVLYAHHDSRTAMAAVTRAVNLHSESNAAPGPFSRYPAAALHYQRAQALATLGDYHGAVTALVTSLRLRDDAERLPAALTHGRLAELRLRLGHLEAALTDWHALLDIYPTVHSARVDQLLSTAVQRLRPYQRHPMVADLLDRIADLTDSPS